MNEEPTSLLEIYGYEPGVPTQRKLLGGPLNGEIIEDRNGGQNLVIPVLLSENGLMWAYYERNQGDLGLFLWTEQL